MVFLQTQIYHDAFDTMMRRHRRVEGRVSEVNVCTVVPNQVRLPELVLSHFMALMNFCCCLRNEISLQIHSAMVYISYLQNFCKNLPRLHVI